MLERFGVHLTNEDRVSHLDIPRSFEAVNEVLSQRFSYRRHNATLYVMKFEESRNLMKQIILMRGGKEADAQKIVEDYVSGRDQKGANATFTYDLPLSLPQKQDYIMFMANFPAAHLPFVLGEEVTHGEHECNKVIDGKISYEEYRNRFHEVSREFLGYLGRQLIAQEAGMPIKLTSEVNMENLLEYSDLAHLLAYFTADDIVKDNPNLPYAELFHARNEEDMWKVVMDLIKHPINLSFAFPPNIKVKNLEEVGNMLIEQSKSSGVIKLSIGQ